MSLPAQTRQGEQKSLVSDVIFKSQKVENLSEVAYRFGFSLRMSVACREPVVQFHSLVLAVSFPSRLGSIGGGGCLLGGGWLLSP